MKRVDERGVRSESATNQLRLLVKQQQQQQQLRRRKPALLDPLSDASRPGGVGGAVPARAEKPSLQKQIQGPITLQWLVDDFVKAAGSGDLEKVDYYIRGGIPIDTNHSVLRYNALHASTSLKHENITKHLVQAGADVNAHTKDHESSLHLAARFGAKEVAREMLRNNAEMRDTNLQGMTPMEIAAETHHPEMERLLEPPPSSPTNVHAVSVTATSLAIAWKSSCGKSSTYLFKVTWLLCGSSGAFVEECESANFHIQNLLPASKYEVSVQAGNHTVGWSASSAVVELQTDNDVPNAMVAPAVIEVRDTHIKLSVCLPQTNGTDISRVAVQIQCTGSIMTVTTKSFRSLLKPCDHDDAWQTMQCDVHLMRNADGPGGDAVEGDGLTTGGYKQFVTTGLSPGHVYFFRAKAFNRNGWSPDGEISDGICTNECPKVVSKTARTMTLVWAKPYSTELIDCYEIQARLSSHSRWETVATDITAQSLVIPELLPASAYSFRVVPHYAQSGWEEATECACSPLASTDATTPEPPTSLRVLDRTAHSLCVTWEIPRCNGHVVLSYALEIRTTQTNSDTNSIGGSTEWREVDSGIPVDFKVYTIGGLNRGSGYQLRVRARNALGDGAFLETPGEIWTYHFLPPCAPRCMSKTSFSLLVTWRDVSADDQEPPPQCDEVSLLQHESNTEELRYELQMCRVESDSILDLQPGDGPGSDLCWTVVARNLRECSVQVSGLHPLGRYCFRVGADSLQGEASSSTGAGAGAAKADGPTISTASASCAFGPISAVFQTLRRI